MRVFHSLTKNKSVPFIAGLLIAVVGLIAGSSLAAHKVSAADASNDIIYGGFSSPANFVSTVRSNNSGSGHHDLVPIYNHYGFDSSQYNRFVKYARQGTAYQNGNLVVDGNVVGTNGFSIGRNRAEQGAGVRTVPINGTDYYGNTNDRAFASSSLPATVLFDAHGKVQFAVLNNCGNPLTVTPQAPSYSCRMLNVSQSNPQDFTVSSQVAHDNLASVDHVSYNFGDGTVVNQNNPSTVVPHHYSAAGNYKITVTVYINLPGGGTDVIVAAGNCVHTVSVPKPDYSCVSLVGAILDRSNNSYKLTVTASYGNGAHPVSADFNFGDGKTQNGVGMTGKTLAVNHNYPNQNQTYTATALVHFIAYGKPVSDTSPSCKTPIPVTVPYCQALTGAIIDTSKYEAQFVAKAVLNGRTLTSADFNFGDGKTQNGVKANTSTTVVVQHDYAQGGTYNALATLHFTYAGHTYTAPSCRALVKPTAIVSECKPGVPLGSPECTPCIYNSNLPSNSPECIKPETNLPNTGAGNTIAIFSAAVVGGFLIYRQVIYRQHKAAFLAAERGTSPLPLGDPIDAETPLRDTPLEPTRSTFRRRRPF